MENPSLQELSLKIHHLEPGMLLVKFLDVPPKLRHTTGKTIAFLRKFEFRNLTVRRFDRTEILDADELEEGDYLLAFGRLVAPVTIKNALHVEVLKQVGFEQALVLKKVPAKKVKTIPVAQELSRIPISERSQFDPNWKLGGRKTTGVQADKKRSQFDNFGPEPAASTPSRKDPTAAGELHAIQDHLGWAQRVTEEGTQLLDELYSTNFINQQAIKGSLELGAELVRLVEANPQAGQVMSLLHDEDRYTYRHSVDVAHYVISACHVMRGLGGERLAAVASGALLHDVGKSKLPKALLLKQGRFNERERALMRQHPDLGAELLGGMGFGSLQIDIVRHHHVTRIGGYPNFPYQKTTNLARLTGVCDIYQALTTRRPYKETEPPNQALRSLLLLSKSQIDPEVVLFFIKALGVFPVGSTVLLSNQQVAFVVGRSENSARPKVVPVIDAQGEPIINHDLIDLSLPDFAELSIQTAVDHHDYFKDQALDLFQNLSVL
ncbi:MAG: HDIG domain-containing protein [bacterium]|nr:HDIG domain-containing protein [bacterium]